MISYDPQKLETVYKFVSFLEAVSNPKALKDLVEDLKKTSDELKSLEGLKEIKDNADSYLDRKEKEAQDKAAKIMEDVKSKLVQADAALSTASKAMEEAELASKERKELNASLREETKRYEGLSAEAQTWLKALTVREEKIAAKEVDLVNRQLELDQKALAIKSIIG